MCSPHVSFLSNVIPKNVIWSLNSISLPKKVSFCNDPMIVFLLENIIALVFKVEILKPQSWDHISILSRADWIFLSASLGDECLVQTALSSAHWESDRFGTSPRASSKVFIMTSNKMGLRTLPWGQPFFRLWMSDVSFPTLTCIFLPFKKLWIQWNIFPFIPRSFNFMSVPVVHVRSKAFSRSRVTAAWHLFSIKAIFISDSRRTSWSIVDLCFLKPLWLFERWPFFVKMRA